jgi:peptidyl-prolyl cis-trans isomerase SurA
MKVANDIRAHVVSCQGMDKVAAQIKGSVYADLGVAKLGDLSQQIQDAIAKTQPGETAAPFMDEAGIEIIARCDKRPQIRTAFQIPSRDDVEQQLFEAQISALARRYKRDLKRDADIQVR